MKLEIINIENCYGIGKIQEKFLDFSRSNSYLLYAQNGFLKLHLQKA
ncbi:hypothetical protein KVM34_07300 [Helicobacter pylori]|nr:hypothetical protein KVM34_07300 [Helicobacter pylori]